MRIGFQHHVEAQRIFSAWVFFISLAFAIEIAAQGPVRFDPGRLAASSMAPGRTNGLVVNMLDREKVRTLFNAIFYHGEQAKANWTGNATNCEPGSTSIEYQDAVLSRINFYRAMAGVPADIEFDAVFSAKAQHAALLMSANAIVSHTPDPSLNCFTPEAEQAAMNSNLALSLAGIDAIEAYMVDGGSNHRVGHRRWLLYPQTRLMGNGDVEPADGSTLRRVNANWIIDGNFGTPRPATRDGFVAWPPPGYIPNRLIYPRWSFSYPHADFTNAIVTVSTNGIPLPVHVEEIDRGFGENTIVFVPGEIAPTARRCAERPASDVTFSISISNVVVGEFVTNFNYNVTVFDAEKASTNSMQVTGSTEPEVGRTNRYRLLTLANASGYEFRFGILSPFRYVENADHGLGNVDVFTSGLYPLVQTNLFVSSYGAFHLAHSSPPRPQSFTLKNVLVPTQNSEIIFLSRLGAASTGQVARVQVSMDGGSSWRNVFNQVGTGTEGELTFTQRAASLREFAGRAIQIRFEYGLTFGIISYAPEFSDGYGWYIDDIRVSEAEELLVQDARTTTKPEAGFVPAEPRDYYVDARPHYPDEYFGEWTPGRIVTAVPASILPPEVQIVGIQNTAGLFEIEFEAENAKGSTIFQIEESSGLDGQWNLLPFSELETIVSGSRYKYRVPLSGEGIHFFRVTID